VIIVARLGWAVFNPRQLELNRFYPVFDGIEWTNAITHPAISKSLILAIAVSVILATAAGLLTLTDGGEIFDDLPAWRVSVFDQAAARTFHALSGQSDEKGFLILVTKYTHNIYYVKLYTVY
jgi:hypothetical protein